MLYIISFQSISCSEASPTSPRPHKGPPEGVSIGHPLNLPPGFPHVAQLGPLAGLPLNLPPGFPHVAQLCPLAGLPLNLPPGFPHVAQLCPLAGLPLNLPPGFPSRCSALSSGRSLKTILKPAQGAVFNCAFGASSLAGLLFGLSLNLPPGFQHVAQLGPLGRSLKTILKPAREAVFATATLSTGTPVASRRAEQSHNLSQTGL